MIIKHIDGSEVDTDKLSDVSALILEKTAELKKLCETINRNCLIIIDYKGDKQNTVHWHHPIFSNCPADESLARTAHAINHYLAMQTNRRLGVFPYEVVDMEKWQSIIDNKQKGPDE